MVGEAVALGVRNGLTGAVIAGMRCGVMLLWLGIAVGLGWLGCGLAVGFGTALLLVVSDGNGVRRVKRGSGAAPVPRELIATAIPVAAASAIATTAIRATLRSPGRRAGTTLT
jgi:hypothetical protein